MVLIANIGWRYVAGLLAVNAHTKFIRRRTARIKAVRRPINTILCSLFNVDARVLLSRRFILFLVKIDIIYLHSYVGVKCTIQSGRGKCIVLLVF